MIRCDPSLPDNLRAVCQSPLSTALLNFSKASLAFGLYDDCLVKNACAFLISPLDIGFFLGSSLRSPIIAPIPIPINPPVANPINAPVFLPPDAPFNKPLASLPDNLRANTQSSSATA